MVHFLNTDADNPVIAALVNLQSFFKFLLVRLLVSQTIESDNLLYSTYL